MTDRLAPLEVDENLLQLSADVPLLVILDAALATAATVIWDEHCPEPELLLDRDHVPEPACLTSHLLIVHINELRHLLRLHLTEMKRVLPPDQDEHLF